MIFYILLIVFAGLMTLIAIALTIGGLIKHKRKLWIGSLCAFVFFSLVTVYAGYTYVRESINYMDSDEFQAETKKKAHSMGKTWGNTVSGSAEGLESTLDEEAIAKLAEKSGKVLGKSVTAISKGMDESAGKTTVFADESVEKAGIILGRAEQITKAEGLSFGLFLEYSEDFDGQLILTAYDSKGLKQDISELKVTEKAGKAQVYIFKFEYFQPGLSGYCILTKK